MKPLLSHSLRNRYLLVSDVTLLAVAAYVSYVLRLEAFDWATYERSRRVRMLRYS